MVEQESRSIKEPVERKEPAMFTLFRLAAKDVSGRAYNQKIRDNLGNKDTIDGLGPKLLSLGVNDKTIRLMAARVLILAEAAKEVDSEARSVDAAINWAISVPKKLESGEWDNEVKQPEKPADSVVLASEFSAKTELTSTTRRYFRRQHGG